MPRPLKIDFYHTESPNGQPLDIADAITRAFLLAVADRRVDFGDSFLLLHNVRNRGPLLLGEIVKAKMTDLPDKINKRTGVPAELGLRADEGIGRHAHFLYDGGSRTVLLQRDRDVRHPAFREGVAVPSHVDFNLSLIFKPDALDRLNSMRVIRKLTFKIARPQNPEVFRAMDPSAEHAIDLLNDYGGRFIDVNVSVGRSREASLNRQSVLHMVQELFGRRGEDVRKVIVSGRESEDSAMEIIDLFEDRLVYEEPIDYRARRIDPAECDRILLAAHEEHREYLRSYQRPE